ncbi:RHAMNOGALACTURONATE LYASE FAMILY PROTEIN [Salix viminalis]|uniref:RHAMNOGALACTURONATE LYASE FAMILY PROTEIN n=1 Tax=Salix viminalis TaxID=40686 RepID=A0A9Q0QHJ4_SALVM|nr:RHAMNOGALACTURONATE LYASE FAMILY PROTEIN [Salix viminalis]
MYMLSSGVSGFHCDAIYELLAGSPAFDLAQTRMVFKWRRDMFHYTAITDEKQSIMPMSEDLLPDRAKQLIVPESVLLIDDKYQYSMDNKDGGVHGWISSGPIIGFWVIFS